MKLCYIMISIIFFTLQAYYNTLPKYRNRNTKFCMWVPACML